MIKRLKKKITITLLKIQIKTILEIALHLQPQNINVLRNLGPPELKYKNGLRVSNLKEDQM